MHALYKLTGPLVSTAWNWGSSIDDRKKYELSKRIEQTVAHINPGENNDVNLEELRAILLETHDLGLTQEKVEELNIIREFCDKIILKRKPVKTYILPREILTKIFDSCAFEFSEIFKNHKAFLVVAWIIKTGNSHLITNANFSFVPDFDNACLKKLTKICPNIKDLNLGATDINGFSLDYLEHVKGLNRLRITGYSPLQPHALRGLYGVPELQIIELLGCERLNVHYLQTLKKLRKIKLKNCQDANLANLLLLKHFPDLEYLDVSGCKLKGDALKNLEAVKKLKKLKITCNLRLESDALKHLVHVPELRELHSEYCQFEEGSTKYLSNLPKLEKLNGVKYEIGQDPTIKPEEPELDMDPSLNQGCPLEFAGEWIPTDTGMRFSKGF